MNSVEVPKWVAQGPGECWIACLASLTGIPLRDFPRPPGELTARAEDAYENAVRTFLKSRAWLLQTTWRMAPLGYAIATGPSPRGAHISHCIVTLSGVIAHDPHPSRAGLAGPVSEYEVLIKLVEGA